MGYQALLFCPDEKTARTVTQVLSDLEFTIEACIEPFAAVKKLMGQHFDAVVVDCDNEQNATLLFKSARNSTSNQGSLAVAVVEGQAGVAKAFRIGANLVLTKPINIEQAKGTLRVARGLLRKGDPAKPAAVPAAAPAKPVAAKPAPAAKPAAPAAPVAATTPRPTAPAAVKPAASPTWPATAAASSPAAHAPAASSATPSSAANSPAVPSPAAREEDAFEILDATGNNDSTATPSAPAPVVPPFNAFGVPTAAAAKLPVPAASSVAADVKPEFKAGSPAISGGGAASAPAPAREAQDSPAAEISSASAAAGTDASSFAQTDKPAEGASSESNSYAGAAPTFTFGGSNVPEQASGGSKKILLGVAAAAIVAVALYFGYTQFSGRSTQNPSVSAPTPVKPAPAAIAKPSGAQPATSAVSSPNSQPEAPSTAKPAANDADDASGDAESSAPSSTKSSATAAASKTASEAKPAAAPLVVKGGVARAAQVTQSAPDAPAPSMTGMAAGASAPPPNLVGSESAAKPILQTMNVSQGVSQGLLIKKVQPSYPRNALTLRIEGSVELMETISKTGDITHIKILSGDPQLTRAAAEAVKQWKYKPYLLNGEPVEIQTQVTINFKLPN
jgi:protein TonB